MLWNDVIELVKEIEIGNDMGDLITTKEYREVFANRKSIRQSEFYQAQATGLRPELMFEIKTIEYEAEGSLRFGDKDYNIIRTYDRGEDIELICQGVVNHG